MLVILTCEKIENPLSSKNKVDSPILFAQYHINYAWGYQYSGWYVDKKGQIYEVDENAEIKLDNIRPDTIFSEKIMVELLQSASKTSKYINEQVLLEMKKLIIPASFGQLTKPINVCMDFGTVYYFTFMRNREDTGYQAILLYQAGDWAQKNLSQQAAELFELLREFVEDDKTQLPCSP